jgi:predicted site-specific integrase-resolvase
MRSGLTTTGAARKAGINRVTLQEWIRTGRVKAPRLVLRNGRAVRLWSQADIEKLQAVKRQTYRRGRGRKKKKGM